MIVEGIIAPEYAVEGMIQGDFKYSSCAAKKAIGLAPVTALTLGMGGFTGAASGSGALADDKVCNDKEITGYNSKHNAHRFSIT